MIDLARKHSYFEFGENYNLQCWRLMLSLETPQQITSYISSVPNDKLYYKNKPIKVRSYTFFRSTISTFLII